MPLPPPEPQTTPRLTLRLVEEGDLPDLLSIHSLDEVTQFLPYATWHSMDDAQAWFARTQKRYDEGSALQFVLADRANGQVVGTCLLFRFELDSGFAELGYVLGKPHWGRGLMREGLSALFTQAFGTMGLRRLEAQVDPRNVPSHQLLMHMGFTHEGMMRQRWVTKGAPRDINFYGLLRDEWPGQAGGNSAAA